jgi:hypothetical protein
MVANLPPRSAIKSFLLLFFKKEDASFAFPKSGLWTSS